MTFKYFDAHSHIEGDEFNADREELLSKMMKENIGTVAVGVDKESSESAVALAEKYEHVFSAVGQHPTETNSVFDDEAFMKLANNNRTVAIGECGLEYFRIDNVVEARSKQIPLFESQIALAVKVNKPLMIHARPSEKSMDAYHDIIDLLKSAKREYGDSLTGNMHFFAGGVDEARAFLELGFTISYTAVITFARDYDEAIRFAPRDMILSETDSPYVAPASRRGTRNDPLAVKDVVSTLADIRGESEESMRVSTVGNAMRLFKLI
ncbi:Putative deoxyribonuclease YcfH [hydrothermal vent metagenome]|uniref:Deoxyribonuclease YcfH n=1 Tax=hydrothermal vent metagenome TaxID=652676 RepID=A0A3B0VM43_9ZZZZ